MPEYLHAAYIVGCKINTEISSNKPKYTFLLVTSVFGCFAISSQLVLNSTILYYTI